RTTVIMAQRRDVDDRTAHSRRARRGIPRERSSRRKPRQRERQKTEESDFQKSSVAHCLSSLMRTTERSETGNVVAASLRTTEDYRLLHLLSESMFVVGLFPQNLFVFVSGWPAAPGRATPNWSAMASARTECGSRSSARRVQFAAAARSPSS